MIFPILGRFAISETTVTQAQVDLSFASAVCYLELVQDVSDNITKLIGFDEDARYWIGMSIRESVINAIQHGNREDENKTVGVCLTASPDGLVVLVRDQGEGFNEDDLPDPTDSENLLKPSGRGIFYVRSFMDDVSFAALPEGGLEVRMEKRLNREKKGDHDED
ncbi:MAG TPA: ATP-binding protein [Acidobacteriota bacterium]|nr:ATP-binding protein [Acidobacteriota bacterium]